MLTKNELAKYIDHTLLKPTATFADIELLCLEAKEYGFYAVCVNSCYVKHAASILKDSDVKVGSTVGFPLGAMLTASKAFEAAEAVKAGAAEIDMVMNVGLLKSGDFYGVQEDIAEVVKAAKSIRPEAKVKVILETGYLDENEKVSACQLAKAAQADFVKTSTGFGAGGATVDDVKLMKKIVGNAMEVKASGGIRDAKTALAMIEAGATRIGTSSGITIIQDYEQQIS
ncbi:MULTISPECIES: deoxyribose-phosphate aldolase [Tepidanaerobacter]|uniref:deoxyribose-phosphate aldolase n=1 Tax=Tepidanaerobacter TaxID=499228 RepID=UPI000A7E2C27|nr:MULTISPECIES: deoxyribose-phosphate aldolase [Tepidanaerobacter]HHV82688.1 deoxyribose-phosphate aldolase [Tepidanaerobacter syntrophicus]